jgi:MFS family permease
MTEVAESPRAPGALSSTRSALRETRDSLSSVFANPGLRRIQLALAGSEIGSWAYATAVAVWAYGVGGASAVGIWTAIRMVLLALTSPFGALLADRMPRKTVMVLADLVRALLVAAAAVAMWLGTPALVIFVLATLASLASTPFRPAQRALLPTLADRPSELTAANGTSSTLESLAFFVGPAIGALLLTVADVEAVFLVNAASFLWSMLMVLGIRLPDRAPAAAAPTADAPTADAPTADAPTGESPEEPRASFVSETTAGFRSILADRDLLVVTAEVSAQTVVAGASAVFTVVMAVDILLAGPKGVGYLDSALGVGAIVGGLIAISRSRGQKLGQDMTLGVVLWSLPLLLVALWPSPVTAFACVVVLGLANPLVDVNMDTIIQRLTPDAVLGRVFGALETCLIATMALGSIIMPLLLHWIGLRASLAVIGVGVAVLALTGLPRMRALDSRLRTPETLSLLQGIAMFAPLTPAVLESLARSLTAVRVAAGGVVVSLGEESDKFYVIESGLVEVTQGDRVLRREGPGEFFGEIGLLRDVPRTATITAVEDTVLQALDREIFLDAVTGQNDARMAADDVISRRLTV